MSTAVLHSSGCDDDVTLGLSCRFYQNEPCPELPSGYPFSEFPVDCLLEVRDSSTPQSSRHTPDLPWSRNLEVHFKFALNFGSLVVPRACDGHTISPNDFGQRYSPPSNLSASSMEWPDLRKQTSRYSFSSCRPNTAKIRHRSPTARA